MPRGQSEAPTCPQVLAASGRKLVEGLWGVELCHWDLSR